MKAEEFVYKKGYRITVSGTIITPKGKSRSGSLCDGYWRFTYRRNGVVKAMQVHRLQAFQKYGHELFKDGLEVRHINNVSTDNSYDNIGLGTHSENMQDMPPSIRYNKALHASSFTRKHDREKVKEYHSKSESYKKTMEHFGISSKGTLHFILNK